MNREKNQVVSVKSLLLGVAIIPPFSYYDNNHLMQAYKTNEP